MWKESKIELKRKYFLTWNIQCAHSICWPDLDFTPSKHKKTKNFLAHLALRFYAYACVWPSVFACIVINPWLTLWNDCKPCSQSTHNVFHYIGSFTNLLLFPFIISLYSISKCYCYFYLVIYLLHINLLFATIIPENEIGFSAKRRLESRRLTNTQ